MVIDMDSFFDNLDKDELQDNTIQGKKTEKINLDFQKEVEDKILKIQTEMSDKDFATLKQIYDVMKSFNEDLPNKFVSIENKSRFALRDVGEKYSNEFIAANKNNAQIISQRIEADLNTLNQYLFGEKFSEAFDLFKKIQENFSYFPKCFLMEKTILSTTLKNKEIEIFNLIEQYKIKKKAEMTQQLNTIVVKLKQDMRNSNLIEVENNIEKIQTILETIPKVLISIFGKEKNEATKVIIHAENYLIRKYEEKFNVNESKLRTLFNKFHDFYLDKNLNEVLIIYNEILLVFKEIPDFFIDRKIKLYKDISQLFGMLNKLVVTNNITMFMESYEFSKKLDSVKLCLDYAEQSRNINYDNLLRIKSQVEAFPDKYKVDKDDLFQRINRLIERYNFQIQSQNNENVGSNFAGIESPVSADIFNTNEFINNEPVQEVQLPGEIRFASQNNSTKAILQEIESNYKRLRESDNPNEIKNLYKKIIYYLKHTPLQNSVRSNVLKKLNQVLIQKKIV